MTRLAHHADHSPWEYSTGAVPQGPAETEPSLKNTWHHLAGLPIHILGPTWVSQDLRTKKQGAQREEMCSLQSCYAEFTPEPSTVKGS